MGKKQKKNSSDSVNTTEKARKQIIAGEEQIWAIFRF